MCEDLWEPVPVRRLRGRAKSVVAESRLRVLAGGSATAVSLSPPLPPLPPKPVVRPVPHARESTVVTVGHGAARRGRRPR